MARLIVEAISAEWNPNQGDVVYELLMFVTVSRADTGEPVNGLTPRNFRLCGPAGSLIDYPAVQAYEQKWDTEDKELSGVYQVEILRVPEWSGEPPGALKIYKGNEYYFGLQVRTFQDPEAKPPKVVDQGQTVIRLTSVGE